MFGGRPRGMFVANEGKGRTFQAVFGECLVISDVAGQLQVREIFRSREGSNPPWLGRSFDYLFACKACLFALAPALRGQGESARLRVSFATILF